MRGTGKAIILCTRLVSLLNSNSPPVQPFFAPAPGSELNDDVALSQAWDAFSQFNVQYRIYTHHTTHPPPRSARVTRLSSPQQESHPEAAFRVSHLFFV